MSGRRPGHPKGSIRDPQMLRTAAQRSQKRPFFTQTDLKSQDEGDEAPDGEKTDPGKDQYGLPSPNTCPIGSTATSPPMITQKEKGSLVGFAQPSSPHVPAYCHPDYIPSQFLRREVAADFQNRSINPGPKCDTMQCCQCRAEYSSHLYSTIQTLRELYGAGSRQGEKCTRDKDKLKKSAWEVLE
ncbi:hypothetical protein B0H14DRAFT_3145796 [Mycena olivaceomarginata]|nr:hypothetical protein B0H14DRAFT_3145796 [Mycena olivaceomarginata]